MASVANYVKSKADAGGAVISLSSSTDVAEAVADAGISSGSNFVSSIADQYTGWDITDSNTYKDLDELVSAQIATQSELSDGLLTEAEASDGAQLIVEFSEAISETVTVTITGQGSLELEVEFTALNRFFFIVNSASYSGQWAIYCDCHLSRWLELYKICILSL